MDWFPLFVDLRNAPVLVVGGGVVAERKIRLLLRADAAIQIAARELTEELASLESQQKLTHIAPEFEDRQVVGKRLIVAATDDKALNKRVAQSARAANVPVNVVDDPEQSTTIFPSILDRSPVIAAISSSGVAPVLARNLRTRLETLIPSSYGELAKFCEARRAEVRERLPTEQRRRFWEDVLQGPIAELVLAGNVAEAEVRYQAALAAGVVSPSQGEVYLVGGGPGDPDLLTFRALRLMQQCDVAVYDRLVSDAVMDLVRRDAERIFVGKTQGRHPVPQEEINQLLIDLAKEGKRVLRLKGGDPFIFGRGGEEIDRLAEAQIPFQVVPGITAANGCAAYAGIPLTHRDYAQSCQFITAHQKDGQFELDWPSLIAPNQTLVFYMGVGGISKLFARLIESGAKANRPAAIIERGTRADQRVITGTLSNLPEQVLVAGVEPPALIVVGEVVTLRERLQWFEGRSE